MNWPVVVAPPLDDNPPNICHRNTRRVQKAPAVTRWSHIQKKNGKELPNYGRKLAAVPEPAAGGGMPSAGDVKARVSARGAGHLDPLYLYERFEARGGMR